MKLVSNKKKKQQTILIAAGAVLLVAIIVLAVVLLTTPKSPEDPEAVMRGINIATHPKLSYYVGEDFSSTGISVQVVMSKQSETYFVDESQLTFSGFDSSVATESLTITVEYKGYTTSYKVEIKEKPAEVPKLTGIRLDDSFKTTYTLESWNTKGPRFRDVNLICTYSDGTEKEIPMQAGYASGINLELTSAGTTSFKISYSEGGIKAETIVTVTITN